MKDKHATEIHCRLGAWETCLRATEFLNSYCIISVYQQSVHCILYFHVTFSRDSINDGLQLSPSSPEEINSVKIAGEREKKREREGEKGGRER